MKHLLSIKGLKRKEIFDFIKKASLIKKNPKRFSNALEQKSLLMLFAKPSLRTRLSFEVAMTQLGGHAIFYSIADSPLGKKETIADTAKTASRYCDAIMARLFEHTEIEDLARNSSIPVINGLTNLEHPCQILSDFLTINEKKGKLKGLKLAYVGDCNNNTTHSLLYGCALAGIHIAIASPKGKEFEANEKIFSEAQRIAKDSKIESYHNAENAVKGADIIYTDSWMSYHIPKDDEVRRIKILKPFQVNSKLMSFAKKNAVFMHCLPAWRGYEVTSDVIDSNKSIVFDQAENRLHMQKAILLFLFGKI